MRTWLAGGYLVRRPGEAREELYELSDGALTALRFIEDLATLRTELGRCDAPRVCRPGGTEARG